MVILITYIVSGFDTILLQKTQVLVDFIGRWTNRNNFTLAIDIAILIVFCQIFKLYKQPVLLVGTMIGSFICFSIIFWRAKQKRADKIQSSGAVARNPLQKDGFLIGFRASIISTSLQEFLVSNHKNLITNLLFTLLLFVICCDPPPSKTTLKSRLSKLSNWLQEKITGSSPTPQET